MIFNSTQFIGFLLLVVVAYYALPHKYRWLLLLVASWTFYMAWNPIFMVLLLFSVGVNFALSIAIENTDNQNHRKRFVVTSVLINFGVLFIFKYLLFFSAAMTPFLTGIYAYFGGTYTPPPLSIILPMGISFYTFQAAGYTIDVYRRQQEAQRNFFKFSLFITFFPQLVAGPIERANNLMPQLFTNKHFNKHTALTNLTEGGKFLLMGFFQKVVIADRISVAVNTVYNAPTNFSGLSIIIATLLFAFQIYCDFCGYSNIAVGCAKILGINLMTNFNQPYLSTTIKDFWRRWHISLSTWFKDYVYFPLGGSRVSKPRYLANTMTTFLVSGLWHGANWTFVVWGALHGLYQVLGEALPKPHKPLGILSRFFAMMGTFALVCFAWIFFRANTITDARYMVTHLFADLSLWANKQYVFDTLNSLGIPLFELAIGVGAILILMAIEVASGKGSIHQKLMNKPAPLRFCFYLFLATLILGLGVFHNAGEFIYFQF